MSREARWEQVNRFQRIVNDTQLARLNKMMKVLNEDILDTPQHYTFVVIDDLDRDWVDERIANDLIRCLFQTVTDLKRVRHLKVLVALRTNIFQELDFGRRGGGQEEKFRALVLAMRWTGPDLEELLDQRVAVAAGKAGMAATTLAEWLPNANKTRGNPLDYLLERTLMRPRDAIAFANECFRRGVGKTKLTWQDMHAAERIYSSKRLLALRDEWKATYPGIDQAVDRFRHGPVVMTRAEFTERLDQVMLLLAEPSFPGVLWLTKVTGSMWNSGQEATWYELYEPLLQLLYSIGLIGCAKTSSAAPVFHLEDPDFVTRESNLDRVTSFFIHRTYHTGLDLRQASDVLRAE